MVSTVIYNHILCIALILFSHFNLLQNLTRYV